MQTVKLIQAVLGDMMPDIFQDPAFAGRVFLATAANGLSVKAEITGSADTGPNRQRLDTLRVAIVAQGKEQDSIAIPFADVLADPKLRILSYPLHDIAYWEPMTPSHADCEPMRTAVSRYLSVMIGG